MLRFAEPLMLEGTSKNWINFPRQTTPQATVTTGGFFLFITPRPPQTPSKSWPHLTHGVVVTDH